MQTVHYSFLQTERRGNNMDGSQYVPSQKNMITLTDDDAYCNVMFYLSWLAFVKR